MASSRGTLTELKQSLPDPLLSDMYRLEISRIPQPAGGATRIAPGNNEGDLSILCQQVSLPSVTVEPVEAALGGMSVVFAGRVVYSHDLTITFVENNRLLVYNTLIDWSTATRNYRNQQGNYKAQYATTAKLHVYDQLGDSPIQTFKLDRLWCSSVPEIQFDSSSSNLVTISATFQYDHWEVLV